MIFTLLLAAGLCELPPPANPADPEAAKAYLDVGDAEKGSDEAARFAYREAARLDPANARAREAYLASCVRAARDAFLDDGRRRMDRGDCDGAIAIFGQVRKAGPDALASLLEGVCRYEQGDDDDARPLLEEAEASPAQRAQARYFLGLIELRDRSGRRAAELFEDVAATGQGTLAARAATLRTTALRSGRYLVSVSAESGYDSNLDLAPDGAPANGDGTGAGNLWLSLRPTGLSGPYLRGNAYYRRQLQSSAPDFASFSGQGGFRRGRGETYAFADYALEGTFTGGTPWLVAHRLRAGARWQAGRFALSGVYAVRFGSFQTAQAYSGTLHSLLPDVTLRFPMGSSVSLGYEVARDAARLAETSSWLHGPRATLRLVLRPTLRATAEAGLTLRSFDGPGATATDARSDTIGYGSVSLHQDLERVSLHLTGYARRAASNLAGLSYSRFTVVFGVSYTFEVD